MKSHAENASLNRSAALASIGVAAMLVVIKAWAAWKTGSTAMLGSLADTGLDLISSLATFIGVWVAGQPDDRQHRFGHGKAEALSAMFQVVLISMSAIALLIHSAQRIVAHEVTTSAGEGILVSVVAIVATLGLLAWQRHVIRRTASVAISTDHLHYQADLLVNIAVVAALALEQYWHVPHADPIFGIGIALWLAWGAWSASQAAIFQLMDREWPEEKRRHFVEVMARHPELRGVHDLRTRSAGNRDFVQFHVWVDPDMSIRDAHRVMDEIEIKLRAEFPGVEMLIHPDPEGHVDTGLGAKDLMPSD